MAFAEELELAQIKQAAAGDEPAQERLFRCYQQRVYTLAYRLMGNRADAQDVVQDSFIRCFESLHQFRGEAPFWAWMKQLTVRTALMRLRSLKRWRWISFDHTDPAQDNATDVSGPAEQAQAGEDLQRALNQLTPTARAVVYLYHGEGYNHAEIAALWGKSVSFSKSQLARAQQRLRQLLEPEGAAVPELTGGLLSAATTGDNAMRRQATVPATSGAATLSSAAAVNFQFGDEGLS